MIPGTNWMIGTGTYMDDIEAELVKYQATMAEHLTEKMTTLFITHHESEARYLADVQFSVGNGLVSKS